MAGQVAVDESDGRAHRGGMNVDDWLKVLTAVLVGNAMTAWWAYCAWRVTRNEHKGIAPHRGPLIYLIGIAAPPLAALAGALLLRATG